MAPNGDRSQGMVLPEEILQRAGTDGRLLGDGVFAAVLAHGGFAEAAVLLLVAQDAAVTGVAGIAGVRQPDGVVLVLACEGRGSAPRGRGDAPRRAARHGNATLSHCPHGTSSARVTHTEVWGQERRPAQPHLSPVLAVPSSGPAVPSHSCPQPFLSPAQFWLSPD